MGCPSLKLTDVDLYEDFWIKKSREDFYAYRQYIGSRDFKKGWFHRKLSRELQGFYEDLRDGKKPILIIEAPPQHGKSRAVTEFLSWLFGKMPELAMIYASYSDRLGVRANRFLQKTLDSEKYQNIFPDVKLGTQRIATLADRVLRNNEIFEIVDHTGSFRNTTVNGSVTGESLDLGIIDDPVKGRAEANSKTVQEKTWDWFTDDFYTRFSEDAGLLLILTRWSKIDLAERLKDTESNVRIVTFKAIADTDEEHRKEGEALFPEHKSLEFLQKRKDKMASASWLSLYQQSPIILGGNIFKFDHWQWWKVLPEIKYLFITVDTASKKNTWNDFTVFQCWAMAKDAPCIYLIDMIRKRMEAHELRKTAKMFYTKHNTGRIVVPVGYRTSQTEESVTKLRKMYVEDKSSGIGLIQDLKKDHYKIEAIPRSTDKVERAYDSQPEIEAGKVYLCEGVPHVSYITEEGTEFPNGAFDDAIDDTMTAIEVAFISGPKEIFVA